jgi:hypothetical protein
VTSTHWVDHRSFTALVGKFVDSAEVGTTLANPRRIALEIRDRTISHLRVIERVS